MMEFSLKPDFEESYRRYEAFFHGQTIDRPIVSVKIPVDRPRPLLQKEYENERQRWLDVKHRAINDAIDIANAKYPYDAMPVVFPNMGPEIYSAWCGCAYHFGENTTWTEPCVKTWDDDLMGIRPDDSHPLYQKTMEYTHALLQHAKGRFIVGLTDFHPGADHLAACRDPAQLCMDLMDCPKAVKKALDRSYEPFFEIYDRFYQVLQQANMPISSWLPGIHRGRYYIPSCDFSYMISPAMFEEFFLEGIVRECRFYDASIYHLDGPDALVHLDALLEIEQLGAVQWVPGAGNEGFERWIDVYKKIQQKKKGVYLMIDIKDLDRVFDSLRPDGVWFASIRGVFDMDTLDAVVKRIEKWA